MSESPNFHGNFDDVGRGGVLLDGDSAGRKSRLHVRVLAILTIVLDAAVLDRSHISVGFADFDNQVGVSIDNIVLPIICPAPSCEYSSWGEKQRCEGGETTHLDWAAANRERERANNEALRYSSQKNRQSSSP